VPQKGQRDKDRAGFAAWTSPGPPSGDFLEGVARIDSGKSEPRIAVNLKAICPRIWNFFFGVGFAASEAAISAERCELVVDPPARMDSRSCHGCPTNLTIAREWRFRRPLRCWITDKLGRHGAGLARRKGHCSQQFPVG
jgi:hypothetical protein